MSTRIFDIILPSDKIETLCELAEKSGAANVTVTASTEPGIAQMRIIASKIDRQQLLDRIQFALRHDEGWRVVISKPEAIIPHISSHDVSDEKQSPIKLMTASREELYQNIMSGAALDRNFIVLTFLSTIVAAIGLVENNVAVLVGAMVIAPLLGPNLAFAFGTAIGDKGLMIKGLRTAIIGMILAIGLSMTVPFLLPISLNGAELMGRTHVGFDGVVLALASGAAGALSITTGLSATLVGVMVAVALLPPAVTFGIMLSAGEMSLALGAFTLLAVNVVCVNLSAKFIFLTRGITARTWSEKKDAKQGMIISIGVWVALLSVLLFVIYTGRIG
jgi:uncharacterized hydrophobic protein (TIGR00341 family)